MGSIKRDESVDRVRLAAGLIAMERAQQEIAIVNSQQEASRSRFNTPNRLYKNHQLHRSTGYSTRLAGKTVVILQVCEAVRAAEKLELL